MNNNLLIIGAGGHGRAVKEVAEAMGSFGEIRFLDDQASSEFVIGTSADVVKLKHAYHYVIPAFGDSALRMKWIKKLEDLGYTVPILIHPSAYVSPSATIDFGTVVMPHAMIHTNVVIRRGCICSIGSIVDHDAVIESGCHIDCGAIVKSHCVVMANTKIESGVVVSSRK
ncbi:hypothetical protein [Ectobacillus polymachus]|uniref:PglD-related sugar-binding protein n=1 Tax=Ectobacillus polymachus TaxID=1508806 RepID=UPI003A847B55